MDSLSGEKKYFVNANANKQQFENHIQLEQVIRPNELSANKVHNLRLSSKILNNLVIQPKQILSLWHLIGAPIASNGYKMGRAIVNNQLSEDTGGGLCQLSGMLYHLSLLGGLEILERHPHSIDLYDESNRYTPLGSDATIAYGYKDLRIRNNGEHPVAFYFDVQDEVFIGVLTSPVFIEKQSIRFDIKNSKDGKLVKTIRANTSGEQTYFDQSFYKNMPNPH